MISRWLLLLVHHLLAKKNREIARFFSTIQSFCWPLPRSHLPSKSKYHPQPHRKKKAGSFGWKQPTPFCVERVTLSQPGLCHFCTAIFMASFTCGWLDGGYMCIYLDLPFVCKRNLPFHQQKPTNKWQKFYISRRSRCICTHNIR